MHELTRAEALPEDPEDHYRLKPPFGHPRWYYLRKLRRLVEYGRDAFVTGKFEEKNIKLADYGCGTKPYQVLFKSKNIDYIGIDLAWNPHASIIIGSDSLIQCDDNQMDVVLSTQVLEHVEDPEVYLKESHRILKADGLLLLTTHGYWMYHPDPTDYWRWTSSGLRKIVERNGFEILAFRGIIGRAAMGLQLFQDGLMFKIPKIIRPLLTFPLQILIAVFDKIGSQKSTDADGCTYLVVAKAKK